MRRGWRATPASTRLLVVLLAVPIAAVGCRDVGQALELRDAIRNRLGWNDVTVRVAVGRGSVEIVVTDPRGDSDAPVRGTARRVARLADSMYVDARDSDSVAVTFRTGTTDRDDRLRSDVEHRYVFPTDSL